MTPYELRYEIFKTAKDYIEQKYITELDFFERHYEEDKKLKAPKYPTFEDIEVFANRIKSFVDGFQVDSVKLPKV